MNYKLDEDEYGGEDGKVNKECEALRRYINNINPATKFVANPKYVLSEGEISALTGRWGLKNPK